ncbi:MAG: hypothetical protein AAGB31_14285 [Bdellovibrio sp.]
MLDLILTLFLHSDAIAQNNAQKKSLNTQLFEQEEESGKKEKSLSFSAKVRAVREDSDGVEVFFEGDKAKGAFTLSQSVEHYAKKVKALEESRKPGGKAVSITADAEKRIKSVEAAASGDSNGDWGTSKLPD